MTSPSMMVGIDWNVTPLLEPPNGGRHNFENPVNRTPVAIGVSMASLTLAIIATIIRFYARSVILKRVGWDDWVALMALIVCIAYTGYCAWMFGQPGMATHIWDTPGAVFLDANFGRRLLVAQALYPPTALLIKLSILLLFKRVFVSPGGRSRWFILGGIYSFSAIYLVMFILSWAFCIKSTSIVDEGLCHTNGANMAWALAAVNVITDLYLLVIPPFVVAKLHISIQRKSAVAVVFLVGVFATAASVVSVYYRIYVAKNTLDFSWNIIPAGISTIIEVNLGIVCSSLPAINVLFHLRRHAMNNGESYTKGSRTRRSFWPQLLNQRLGRSTNGDASNGGQTDREEGILKLIDIQQITITADSKGESLDPSLHRDLP